ncbi:MAG: dTDP-4-dehydrorhamnose reductase [Prevotella sp.]|nr:dTDP-4-dehydrorhamnose reductase [Prevotella sp.]
MNILVTGANGQLGNEMRLLAKETSDNYLFTDVVDQEGVETVLLDITDLAAVRDVVKTHHIEAIVNCAAYTNVDAAETNEALAEKLNAAAPENLALAMKEVGGLLVQISTDYVFGKEPYNVPCREEQKGTPTGVYGLTKLHGEQRIAATGCKHVIIRTAWLYSEFGKNFCKTMLQLTATKPRLNVVFDQAGTPTYALDLARAIAAVLADYAPHAAEPEYAKGGVYNYSNEGVCSWYDFTMMILFFGNELRAKSGEPLAECDVQPCHSDEFPSPVTRPAYSVLDKTKIKQAFSVSVPYWTESLKQCINNLKH